MSRRARRNAEEEDSSDEEEDQQQQQSSHSLGQVRVRGLPPPPCSSSSSHPRAPPLHCRKGRWYDGRGKEHYVPQTLIQYDKNADTWLVQWQGYDLQDSTWEPSAHLRHLELYRQAVEKWKAKIKEEEESNEDGSNGSEGNAASVPSRANGKKRKASTEADAKRDGKRSKSSTASDEDSISPPVEGLRRQPVRTTHIEKGLAVRFTFREFELFTARLPWQPITAGSNNRSMLSIDPFYPALLRLLESQFILEKEPAKLGTHALILRTTSSKHPLPEKSYIAPTAYFPLAAITFDLHVAHIDGGYVRVLRICYAATWKDLQRRGFGAMLAAQMKLLRAELSDAGKSCMLLVNCMTTPAAHHFWKQQHFIDCEPDLVKQLTKFYVPYSKLMYLPAEQQQTAYAAAVTRNSFTEKTGKVSSKSPQGGPSNGGR